MSELKLNVWSYLKNEKVLETSINGELHFLKDLKMPVTKSSKIDGLWRMFCA